MIPNPSQRVEDIIFDKIEKKRPQRLSNLEYLGSDMIEVKTCISYLIILCVLYVMQNAFVGWSRIWAID